MCTPDRRPGRSAPGVVLVLLALILAACGHTPRAASLASTTPSPPSPATDTTAAPRVVPTSVRVAGIDVLDAALLRLGIAPDGSAEVPEDYDRVGWFDRGAAVPGGGGPTVLLGHVDSRTGPAAFYRLRDLRPGDVVELGRSDGSLARYAVQRTEQVAKDRFPTFAVFGATREDVLRLVTCAGAFDRGARSYTDNLVVHAVRV